MRSPLCGITHEQMLVLLSSQSKSFGSAAALAPEGLDPDANGSNTSVVLGTATERYRYSEIEDDPRIQKGRKICVLLVASQHWRASPRWAALLRPHLLWILALPASQRWPTLSRAGGVAARATADTRTAPGTECMGTPTTTAPARDVGGMKWIAKVAAVGDRT